MNVLCTLQIPQLPNPPPDVERNPTLLAEYESIAGQIKSSCHQVALLDRVHNIKVQPSSARPQQDVPCLYREPR